MKIKRVLGTKIPLGWLIVVIFWALTVSVFCFYRNPLPFPDRGHRCFAVPSEAAAVTVAGIFSEFGDLPERFTFDVGTTTQTLLWDNTTVLIQHHQTDEELPPNGVSLAVDDPPLKAEQVVKILREAGFEAEVMNDFSPEIGDKLVIITSDAFNGWVLVLRKHILEMGAPPNKRSISS